MIYRSPGLGAATVTNDSAVSTQGNNNVGVTQGNVPTSDSSVPTDTIPQSQQERKGEGKESAADNYQQAVEWMQVYDTAKTEYRITTKISNTEIDNLKPASVIMEEAKELYNTAEKKFSSITDKAVSESVKEAIQQTLDFGEGFGEILERASGKAIQQSLFSEENAEQANDVRGNTGRIPHQRKRKEIGFSLTRDLINNGFGYTIRRKRSIL